MAGHGRRSGRGAAAALLVSVLIVAGCSDAGDGADGGATDGGPSITLVPDRYTTSQTVPPAADSPLLTAADVGLPADDLLAEIFPLPLGTMLDRQAATSYLARRPGLAVYASTAAGLDPLPIAEGQGAAEVLAAFVFHTEDPIGCWDVRGPRPTPELQGFAAFGDGGDSVFVALGTYATGEGALRDRQYEVDPDGSFGPDWRDLGLGFTDAASVDGESQVFGCGPLGFGLTDRRPFVDCAEIPACLVAPDPDGEAATLAVAAGRHLLVLQATGAPAARIEALASTAVAKLPA